MPQHVTYTFGVFLLETNTRLLCYEGNQINLQPKIYHLLLYFLQHAGQLITKQEIFAEVWRGTIVVDSALRLAINTLRKILGDESKTPRYIVTLCKCGYRFISDVSISYPTTLLPQNSRYPSYHHDNELHHLLATFQQTMTGKRQLVYLNGERGIGKTALIEQFLAHIDVHPATVLRANCIHLTSSTEPFLPLLDTLQQHCRQSYGNPLINFLRQIAPSWLYQMLNVLTPEELTSLQSQTSHNNPGRMLREGVDFFETLSQQSPFILILDNAQWSDNFTLDLINFLICRHSSVKLLIIISYRPNLDCIANQRIEEMHQELNHRQLCQELTLHSL